MNRSLTESTMFTRVGYATLAFLILAAASCSGGDDSEEGSGNSWTAAREVVVNEFNSLGDTEWIELANKGSQAVDLGSFGLADTDKGTGLPKTAKAMRFPAGTSIPAGGYVLVLTGQDGEEPGPYLAESCLAGANVTCFKAGFQISAASGEELHLIAPDDQVVSSTAYPSYLASDSGADKTACRSPDRTGDFALCTPTPGAANSP